MLYKRNYSFESTSGDLLQDTFICINLSEDLLLQQLFTNDLYHEIVELHDIKLYIMLMNLLLSYLRTVLLVVYKTIQKCTFCIMSYI